MKLGICSNFVYPSIGGSEIVCREIAEAMVNNYGMEVICFGFNVDKEIVFNNVKYSKILLGPGFIKQIQDLDHIFIYSDSFWGFETILKNINSIKASLSINLLGMYNMIENHVLFQLFNEKIELFKIITHTYNYQDYKKCLKENISVEVIPNGINLHEFNQDMNCKNDFKEKYNIKTKYTLLNVSNFFYGKGQEHLVDIGIGLSQIRKEKDFTIINISNTVKYNYDTIFLNRCKKLYSKNNKFDFLFLRDIPRQDIVSAFYASDVFVFTSLKEVFPLVILESMASSLPWISMDIGNVEDLEGGIIVKNKNLDKKKYKIFDKVVIDQFVINIDDLLQNKSISISQTERGRQMIETVYNWDNIYDKYYHIFSN